MTTLATDSPCALCGALEPNAYFEKNGYRLVKCRRCGMVQVSEPPTAAELARVYSFAQGYHQSFRDDDRVRQSQMRNARKRLHDLERCARPPGHLLDVGCSAGFFLRVAADAGWAVTGVEFSPDTAQLARERFGLEVLTGVLEDQDLPPGKFDAITMWDLLEHVPEPGHLLDVASRLLVPGGWLALLTPNIDGLFPRVSLTASKWIGKWPHPSPPFHLSEFSEQTLTSMLDRHGFAVEHVKHGRIRSRYSWGQSPRGLLAAAAFAPFSFAGPWLRQGDEIVVMARSRAGA